MHLEQEKRNIETYIARFDSFEGIGGNKINARLSQEDRGQRMLISFDSTCFTCSFNRFNRFVLFIQFMIEFLVQFILLTFSDRIKNKSALNYIF